MLPQGHTRWKEQSVAPPLKRGTDPADLLEEICREGGQTCLIYSVELEGRKKSPILGSSWTSLMSYRVPQWSNGVPWWPLISYLQHIQRNLVPPLLSLEEWCDPWYTWFGSLVVLDRLEDPCPDARVAWEFRIFLVVCFFLTFSLGFSYPCFL